MTTPDIVITRAIQNGLVSRVIIQRLAGAEFLAEEFGH
jgi:hypothetical protein